MSRNAVMPVNFENARIIFKNFEGRESRYNRSGDRNFSVVIDDPAEGHYLADLGWNVRIREPREEGEKPMMSIQVAISFRSFPNIPPAEIYVYTRKSRRKLTEETVQELDYMEIRNVDLTIRPRFWTDDNGETHIKAYLKEMHVTMEESAWEEKYAAYEYPEEG